MVRRNYTRRKHQTNYLVLSYITRYWALNYLHSKQFERFYAAMGRFSVTAYSADAHVFHVKLPDVVNKNGINILSCSKTALRKHLNYSQGANFMINTTKNTNSAMLQALDASSLALSSNVFPGAIKFENSLYCYEGVNEFSLETVPRVDFIAELDSVLFENVLESTNTIYSTLILLTLFNIKSGQGL